MEDFAFKRQQNQRFAFCLSWQERQRISKFAPKNNRFPEPKGTTTFLVSWMNLRQGCPGAIMTTLQAILLGAMLAWTPSLVVLAVLLRDIRDLEESEEFGRGPS